MVQQSGRMLCGRGGAPAGAPAGALPPPPAPGRRAFLASTGSVRQRAHCHERRRRAALACCASPCLPA
jgi:hypothetical protein